MQLLGSAAQDRRRIVVLMSDGLPNDGRTGDELVAYVDSLKQDGVKVYTLSFGDDEQGRALLAQLASEGCSFNANNTDELEGFFSDIADEISGTAFIRAELACPVDVTVTLNGETLSSDPDRLCTRTSFGSLTIEEAPEGDGTTTKVLRLREGEPYDIQITGTDTGTMDYTIGFMDENGDYTDSRSFPQIGVTPTTRMETRAERADETTPARGRERRRRDGQRLAGDRRRHGRAGGQLRRCLGGRSQAASWSRAASRRSGCARSCGVAGSFARRRRG